jgi:hypothetical protein
MVDMSPTTVTAPRRYVLVSRDDDAPVAETPVRRFRLARLDLARPPVEGGDRFAYLKRTYD